MKQSYSTKWKASGQRRKQRKYGYNAPHHIRQKYLGAPLSKDLKDKQGRTTLGVRVGDKVKVMRGQFKGHSGKIDHVNLKRQKIYVEKVELIKKDGNKVMVPIDPSNVQLMELTDDKRRNKKAVAPSKAPVASPSKAPVASPSKAPVASPSKATEKPITKEAPS